MTEAIARLKSMGGICVQDFDFAPFAETAALLYGAPFVAERYAGESVHMPLIAVDICI